MVGRDRLRRLKQALVAGLRCLHGAMPQRAAERSNLPAAAHPHQGKGMAEHMKIYRLGQAAA
ncbi:hypothetical protein SDC9_190671 [bioreactor metagenome]|uniref:Uncharacterized protein n=1 Tax=bioreactor metagenome TaxID=1076179 RepID=A0A645HX94_9ZZZZ